MIFAIVVLAVSLMAMIVMVVAGLYEIKVGRKIIALSARIWCEECLQKTLHTARGVIKVAATKKFWTDLTSYIWRKFVEKVWRHPHVQKVTKKAVDVVRGKKEIKPNGQVSYYLKDVSEYKKDLPL
jgi:hypothetical protein